MPKQIGARPSGARPRLCRFDAQCFSPGLKCLSLHSPGVEQAFKEQQGAKNSKNCQRRDVGKKSPNKDNKEKPSPKKKCVHCKKKAVARCDYVYCNNCYYSWSPSSELLLTEEEKIWMQTSCKEEEPSQCIPETPELPQWIPETPELPQCIPETPELPQCIPETAELPQWIPESPEEPSQCIPETAELPQWIPQTAELPPCTPESPEIPQWIHGEDHAVAPGLSLKSMVVQSLATQAGVPLTLDTLLKIESYNFDIKKFAFLYNVNILYYIVHEYGFALEEVQAIHALLLHVIQRRDLDSITKIWNHDTSTMPPATLLLYCMAPSLSFEGLNILQEQLVDKMVLKMMKEAHNLELELEGVGMSHADIAILSKLVH